MWGSQKTCHCWRTVSITNTLTKKVRMSNSNSRSWRIKKWKGNFHPLNPSTLNNSIIHSFSACKTDHKSLSHLCTNLFKICAREHHPPVKWSHLRPNTQTVKYTSLKLNKHNKHWSVSGLCSQSCVPLTKKHTTKFMCLKCNVSCLYKSQLSQCKKLKTLTEMCWALGLTDAYSSKSTLLDCCYQK
jgi:hypothetical protein